MSRVQAPLIVPIFCTSSWTSIWACMKASSALINSDPDQSMLGSPVIESLFTKTLFPVNASVCDVCSGNTECNLPLLTSCQSVPVYK